MRLRHLDTFRLLFESVRNVFYLFKIFYFWAVSWEERRELERADGGAGCGEHLGPGNLLG